MFNKSYKKSAMHISVTTGYVLSFGMRRVKFSRADSAPWSVSLSKKLLCKKCITKFSPAFFKRRWGIGATPPIRPPQRARFFENKAQEGGRKPCFLREFAASRQTSLHGMFVAGRRTSRGRFLPSSFPRRGCPSVPKEHKILLRGQNLP